MNLIPDGDDPPSRTEVRQFEARIDARFQAINARFTTMDRRVARFVERLDDIERCSRALHERFNTHGSVVDERFNSIDIRVDEIPDSVLAKIAAQHRDTLRTLALAAVAANLGCLTATLGIALWLT